MLIEQLDAFIANGRIESMRINKITVGGFRNIKMVELILDDIISLVSLNSYGKSNVLMAIDFGIDFIRRDERTKSDMMAWLRGIPLNKKIASQDFHFELEMDTNINGIVYKVVYGYKFKWVRDDNEGTRIIDEWLKIKVDEKNQKFNSYISRLEGKGLYRTSESGRCSNKINVDKNELVINKLKAYDFLFYNEIVRRVNNISMYIERHLDASQSFRADPIIRTNMEVFQIDEQVNIPRIIFHLKKQYPDKFELLKNTFMLLFQTISDIDVVELESKGKFETSIPDDLPLRVDKQFYTLSVLDNNINQPINFVNISDGAKRVFLILTSIILADINGYSIIAIEEPENSVHPSLLQKYLRVISQFLVNCKVIITSHSPYIIQYLDPQKIYVGLPNIYGIADFSRIRYSAQKALINDANSLNMSIGDYIFELISGTNDDYSALNNYLEVGMNG